MKTRYRHFGIEMSDLSKVEQCVIQAYAFAKWVAGPVGRNVRRTKFLTATTRLLYAACNPTRGGDHIPVKPRGTVVAMALTLLASYAIVMIAARSAGSPDATLIARNAIFSAVILATLASGLAAIWLRAGAAALHRIRQHNGRFAS